MIVAFAASVFSQTTEFNYQGSLKDGAVPANGNYDFEFRLYDADTGGSQIGEVVTRTNVVVADGIFSVKLDFTNFLVAQFPGADRYLDISVQPSGGGGYTALTPRQKVTSSPYAIKSSSSDSATNATQLGGIAANQYLQTTGSGSGLTNLNASSITNGTLDNARLGVVPVANGGTGSATQNFVDLTTAQTIAGNKTFSGTLSGNAVSTTTTFNRGSTPILSIAGTNNVFVGAFAGDGNTSGFDNSFLGRNAGTQNTMGNYNSFYGSSAGSGNTTGSQNSFYGRSAGANNVVGNDNAFFGYFAGNNNITSSNSFFGSRAGQENTSGISNSFFGNTAGQSNTTGNSNAFFGQSAGLTNTTGGSNSFFGQAAGFFNLTGASNSFFGRQAGYSNTTGGSNSFFGHSAGSSNTVGADNAFFGYLAGTANTASFNSFFGSQAGQSNTSGISNSFFGNTAGQSNLTGNSNSFFGQGAGLTNTTGGSNSFFGQAAGFINMTGASNSFFGRQAGYSNTTGGSNSFFGRQAVTQTRWAEPIHFLGTAPVRVTSQVTIMSFLGILQGPATHASFNSFFGTNAGQSNTSGISNSFFGINAGSSNVSGSNNTLIGALADTSSPDLTYATAIGAGATVFNNNTIALGRADGSDRVRIPGTLQIIGLGSGGTTQLCINSALGGLIVSTCSSSLRYKTNINSFGSGLGLINKLKPITFDWKDGGMHDLGLGAEDVAAIEPLLVTYNKDGQVEGVKYDRLALSSLTL